MIDYEKIARSFRKNQLFDFCQESSRHVDYSREDLKKILAHRDPFLLIDSINAIDLTNRAARGSRLVLEEDPVFKGHFPHYPIYPGVLHIEIIGQLGICLEHFLTAESIRFNPSFQRADVRLIKILHVLFQQEVLPGDDLTIICKELESDDFSSIGIGQLIKNNQVCTVSIAKFYKV